MSNVIILGDPHVGKNISLGKTTIGAALNSRVSDQFALLDWTLEQAVEHHADHIIITGDCFEEVKTHPSLIAMFMSWLKKCQVHDVSVHIIEGNHDILRNGFIYFSPLDIITEADLDLIHIYKDINTIIIDTTAFTLVPFRDRKSFSVNSNAEAISLVRDSLVYELASIPTTYHKALIGHLAIEGSIPVGDEIDDLTNELFCPLDMFKDYDFVIMGHIHAPQVMQKVNPYIAHIGSMDISNFGETDHKKHIIIFDCSTGQWKQENLPIRPLQKITISIPKDIEDTTAYVLQEIEKTGIQNKAIVRVEIVLTTPELKSVNKSMIDKYLSDNGASNIAGISETKKINLIKKDNNNTLDTKMDVIAAIKMFAQTYIEEPLRSAFIELAMETHTNFKLEDKN